MTRRIRTRWHRATERQALDALAGIWRRHGHETFCLNLRGPQAGALLLARWMGWLWCDAEFGSHLTLAGVEALGEHLGRDLIAELIEAERLAALDPEPEHWRTAA
jgi:hypothetical protein